MSDQQTTPERYQPSDRVIDSPERLHELYCEQELTVRAIADEYSDLSLSAVYRALEEYDIIADENATTTPTREFDPPNWARTT